MMDLDEKSDRYIHLLRLWSQLGLGLKMDFRKVT